MTTKTAIVFFQSEFGDLPDYAVEVLYEMIPSYGYTFPKQLSHKEMIDDYAKTVNRGIDTSMYARLLEHKDDIVAKWL